MENKNISVYILQLVISTKMRTFKEHGKSEHTLFGTDRIIVGKKQSWKAPWRNGWIYDDW